VSNERSVGGRIVGSEARIGCVKGEDSGESIAEVAH
jgi:hypothetical protein